MSYEGDTVWLLTIGHRHGEDTTVHVSERSAYGGLLTFVEQFWDEVRDPDTNEIPEMPENSRAAIEMYFDYHCDDEWYEIAPHGIIGEPE